MRQSERKQQPQTVRTPSFEASPWTARELMLEDPGRVHEPPLALEQNEHVVDADLDGEAIRRTR
jgi:hypothetical protein